jgi:hypothetical protein
MKKHFIILEPFQHQVSCCCPGEKHHHVIEFRQYDVWTITDDWKYVDCLGWYSLIEVNNEFQFLMHVEDIEDLYTKGIICSILDLDLRINHLRFKINEALDAYDRELFLSFSFDLNNLQEMRSKLRYADMQVF